MDNSTKYQPDTLRSYWSTIANAEILLYTYFVFVNATGKQGSCSCFCCVVICEILVYIAITINKWSYIIHLVQNCFYDH